MFVHKLKWVFVLFCTSLSSFPWFDKWSWFMKCSDWWLMRKRNTSFPEKKTYACLSPQLCCVKRKGKVLVIFFLNLFFYFVLHCHFRMQICLALTVFKVENYLNMGTDCLCNFWINWNWSIVSHIVPYCHSSPKWG